MVSYSQFLNVITVGIKAVNCKRACNIMILSQVRVFLGMTLSGDLMQAWGKCKQFSKLRYEQTEIKLFNSSCNMK